MSYVGEEFIECSLECPVQVAKRQRFLVCRSVTSDRRRFRGKGSDILRLIVILVVPAGTGSNSVVPDEMVTDLATLNLFNTPVIVSGAALPAGVTIKAE